MQTKHGGLGWHEKTVNARATLKSRGELSAANGCRKEDSNMTLLLGERESSLLFTFGTNGIWEGVGKLKRTTKMSNHDGSYNSFVSNSIQLVCRSFYALLIWYTLIVEKYFWFKSLTCRLARIEQWLECRSVYRRPRIKRTYLDFLWFWDFWISIYFKPMRIISQKIYSPNSILDKLLTKKQMTYLN